METGFFSTSTREFKIANWLSVIGATIVVLSVVILKRFRAPAVDRFTFNLQAAIALVDIPRHIILIYTFNNNKAVCSFLAFLTLFCVHIHILFNVAIAANLQRVYIQDTIPGSLWRKALYVLPVILSLVLDAIPMALGAYGLNRYKACHLTDDYTNVNVMRIILIYITQVPGYLYCLMVFIITAIKLRYTYPYTIEEDGDLEASLLYNNQTLENRQLALRISFYPLSCFLCYSGSMARNIHDFFFEDSSFILNTWCFIGLSSSGILNLVSFLFDPALKSVFKGPPEEVIVRPSSPYTQRQKNFRNRHRAPTPPRPPVPEQQPVEYGPHPESKHARLIRESTEREEKIQFGPSYRVW